MKRRDLIKLGGAGMLVPVTGCVGDANAPGDGDTTPTNAVKAWDSHPFTMRSSRPPWYTEEDEVGRVIVINDGQRMMGVLEQSTVDPEEDEELQGFLEDVDFDTGRLLLIESAGPNLCYSGFDIDDVRLEDDQLQATATVIDTSEEDEACAPTVGFPSVLVKVTFEGEPVNSASVQLIDGWGESGTVAASVDDPFVTDASTLPGYVQPEGDAVPIHPLECEDEAFERHRQWVDENYVHLGDYDPDDDIVFALRVNQRSFERGDQVEIRMTNVSASGVGTGNRSKYNLQVYTEDGWQDVRGYADGPISYTDEAIVHPPGGGFEWSFELTDDGIEEVAWADLEVCPGVSAGRYRFVFFGLIGDDGLAVEFDLE